MKKIVIAFSFCVCAFVASAGNNVENTTVVKSVDKTIVGKEQRVSQLKQLVDDVWVICATSNGQRCCGASEDSLDEAIYCLWLTMH